MSDAITKTYGAVLLGALISTFLSGMSTLQMVLYFRLHPKDSVIIKSSVSAIWCLDIIHTAFVWVATWTYFIVNIGQIPKIDEIQGPELIPGTAVVTTIVTLIVHMFYIHRIFLLSHRKYWICIPILLLAFAHVGGEMATINIWIRSKRFSVFSDSPSRWVLSFGLVFGAAADVAIMLIMAVMLYSSREKSISLDSVIDKMILYTLEMGSITALSAIASMTVWFADGQSLIFGGIYLCIEKVYAISFMGLLNARYHLRQQSQNNSQPWKMSQFSPVVNTSQTNAQLKSELPLQEVHVDVMQSIEYDNKTSSNL